MQSKRWKNRDALVTAFDEIESEEALNNVWLLIESAMIERNKFDKRATLKPMAREISSDPTLAHITNRAKHMMQTAYRAKRIANKLGLNENVAFLGMAGHDSGHAGRST